MAVVIIRRPHAALREFVNVIASNQSSPTMAHLVELVNKPELTEHEANWVQYQVSKHLFESVPA